MTLEGFSCLAMHWKEKIIHSKEITLLKVVSLKSILKHTLYCNEQIKSLLNCVNIKKNHLCTNISPKSILICHVHVTHLPLPVCIHVCTCKWYIMPFTFLIQVQLYETLTYKLWDRVTSIIRSYWICDVFTLNQGKKQLPELWSVRRGDDVENLHI